MKRVKQQQENIYEYAFTPVPKSQQKSTYGIFVVLAGYVMALSCLVTGAQIGYALPFWSAVGASLVGNVILLFIGIMMGRAAYRSGLSTTFLARKSFGKGASALFAICIIMLSINWIGVNGDSFAHMIIAVFPDWPVPIPVTALIVVALWASSAIYGWAGLELISKIVVPLGVVAAAICMILVGIRTDWFSGVATFQPTGQLTFKAAVAAITGNFIFGCVTAPDTCRFAASGKKVTIAIIPAYILGLFALNVCGILIAQAGQNGDFNTAISRLGLSAPFLLCTIPFLWTTQDNNLYGGSLAVQNLFQGTSVEGNLSHKIVVFIISGFAAAFAAFGAQKYLLPIITFISILIPPVPGIILGEEFFIKGNNENKRVNWVALVSWALGGIGGYASLHQANLIAPLMAMITSFLAYVLLSKLVARWQKNKSNI